MEVKEKPCKGTGKAKGSGCGKPTLYRTYGLCQKCKTKWMLETKNGAEYLAKMTLRGKKEYEKKVRLERKKEKESRKSIQRLIQEARVPFNKFIRLRDINKSCISCGSVTSEIWDAGHYFKAELYSGLIFNERNVHKQCRKCNTYLGGNESGYRIGLLNRFGDDFVISLEKESTEKRTYKYTREELIKIKELYRDKVKKYE